MKTIAAHLARDARRTATAHRVNRMHAGLAVAAVLLLGACGGSADRAVETRRSATGDTTSSTAIGAGPDERVLDVGDSSGVRGSIDPAEEDAQWERVKHRALAEGFAEEPDQERRSAVMAALNTLDPLAVRDDEGELVGYFTTHFVSLDEYPAEREAAEAVIAEAKRRN